MIRIHQVITTSIDNQGSFSNWFKDTPFSNILQKVEQLNPEAYGRGDSIRIITIWLTDNDIDAFIESNPTIVWND